MLMDDDDHQGRIAEVVMMMDEDDDRYTLVPSSSPIHTRSVVALAKGHGIEILVNEMSRRETPTAILFRGRR